MKKFLLALAVIGVTTFGARSCHAEDYWGQVFTDLATNQKFSPLDQIAPIGHYDFIDQKFRGGFVTAIYKVGALPWLTLDSGWVSSIETTKERGDIVVGPSIHVDRLARILVPDYANMIRSYLPESAQKFVDALDVGFSFRHQFLDDNKNGIVLSPGVHIGYTISF